MKGLFKGGHSSEWITLPINLRSSQYEALSRLADEMGVSTSRVTRRILAEFLAELEHDHERDGERQ